MQNYDSKKKNHIKKSLYMFLCLILSFLIVQLYFLNFHYITAQAETDPEVRTNLVIFVKKNGDANDIFNAVYPKDNPYPTYRNWDRIRKMYDGGSASGFDNSFSNYIKTISEGKLEVVNVFPQEYTDNSGNKAVRVYELKQTQYDQDYQIVAEVINALNDGSISMNGIDADIKMDHIQNGILDNLTVIVQGNSFNGSNAHAYRAQYAGNETFNYKGSQIHVSEYNALYSKLLVTDDANLGVSQQQGVIAHEFLHTLEFRDLYRYNDTTGIPVGSWDVMAQNNCFLQYPLGYFRAQKGWITSKEIRSSGRYTLTAVSETGEDKLFILKTPMAESDSELICIEYRKKKDLNNFEHYIPSDGIIVYRINNGVDEKENSAGNNYVYVYRPGVTSQEQANDTYTVTNSDGSSSSYNLISKAAINPKEGRSEYGSTDLSKSFNENTIYFSNGNNSGIRISNLVFSNDENTVTFDIEFADYNNAGILNTLGVNAATDAYGGSAPYIYANPSDGRVYVAYLSSQNYVIVKYYNEAGSSWVQVGKFYSGTNFSNPKLVSYSGNLYLSYLQSDGIPVFTRYNGSSWSSSAQIAGSTAFPQNLSLFSDTSGVYASYAYNIGTNGGRLYICNLINNTVITDSLTVANYFSNPSVVKIGSRFYALYSNFPNGDGRIDTYDINTGAWTNIQSFDGYKGSNIHNLTADNNVLYASIGLKSFDTPKNLILTFYCDTGWKRYEVPDSEGVFAADMDVVNGLTYISYFNNSTKMISVYKRTESGLQKYYEMSANSLNDFCTSHDDNYIYILLHSTNSSTFSVRRLHVSGSAIPPLPPVPPSSSEISTVVTSPDNPSETASVKLPYQDEVESKSGVDGFVFRLYAYALTRRPDDNGFQYWKSKLLRKESSGTQVAYGFFFSKEMNDRNLSNSDFVELLYRVMMNRSSDPDGKKYWVNMLDNGVSRVGVFRGFAGSTEYTNICKSYGIERGNMSAVEGRDKNYGATLFVSRLYTKALGRSYDIDGLNYWCNHIVNNTKTVTEISTNGFFHSKEFLAKNLSDEEYIKVLYRTFLGREYDQDGFEYWMNQLGSGKMTRDEVLRGFSYSVEFSKIMKQYGL